MQALYSVTNSTKLTWTYAVVNLVVFRILVPNNSQRNPIRHPESPLVLMCQKLVRYDELYTRSLSFEISKILEFAELQISRFHVLSRSKAAQRHILMFNCNVRPNK